jgi:hypothetical protein
MDVVRALSHRRARVDATMEPTTNEDIVEEA